MVSLWEKENVSVGISEALAPVVTAGRGGWTEGSWNLLRLLFHIWGF